MCLLCPQQIAQQTNKAHDGFTAEANSSILTFDGFTRTIPYSRLNGLPIFFTAGYMKTSLSTSLTSCDNAYVASIASTAAYNVTASLGTEANINRSQRRLLKKHKNLGHLNMDAIQKLARSGNLDKVGLTLALVNSLNV
jgi:hypothetical protein